jgi:hypothetical protein
MAKNEMIQLDIKNEIEELEKDLKFLEFIQSEDVFNVFLDYHPSLIFPHFFASRLSNSYPLFKCIIQIQKTNFGMKCPPWSM